MLRLFTPTVFRESVSDYSLPIVAFESFDDVEKEIDLSSKTFKFLLPVSICFTIDTGISVMPITMTIYAPSLSRPANPKT